MKISAINGDNRLILYLLMMPTKLAFTRRKKKFTMYISTENNNGDATNAGVTFFTVTDVSQEHLKMQWHFYKSCTRDI